MALKIWGGLLTQGVALGWYGLGPLALREMRDHTIDGQEEHHRTRTFQEEYRTFLKKYGIAYDEHYVWD